MYYYIVARSCRTCHIAFTRAPTWNTWNGPQGFETRGETIEYYVKSYGEMPHAYVGYNNMWTRNFWPDVHTPAVFQCFSNYLNLTIEPGQFLNSCLSGVPWPPPAEK